MSANLNFHRLVIELITDKILGALNGVLGDYLEENNNPLSTPMTLFHEGVKVNGINDLPLQDEYKIIIFIHGLTDTEHRWEYRENELKTSFGKKINEDLGFTPLFLRYNTGLHISQNGEKLHNLLKSIFDKCISQVKEIVIVAHSMGGLVTHSAIQQAKSLESSWENKLNKVFLLGSPHQGAPLERGANFVSGVLKVLPQPYLQLASDLLNIRSNGIKDLRYGYTKHEEWEGFHPDEVLKNRKQKSEIFHDIQYYLVAGSVFASEEQLLARWLGDILVPINSAMGYSKNELFHYQFNKENVLLLPSMSHLQLTVDKQVLNFIMQNIG